MRGLVRSELRRMASRRFVQVVGVAVLAGILVGGVAQYLGSEPGLEEARRRAETEARLCREEARRFQEFQRREGGPPPEQIPPIQDIEPDCDPEHFLRGHDLRFRFAQEMPNIVRGVAMVFIVLAFIVAASVAGAEWGSAYVTPLLTWEPRRWAFLVGKLIAVGLAIGVGSFAALALLTATQYPSGVFRGTTTGADGSFWWSLAGLWGKGAALAALWSAAGVALATITRNTAAAIAIGLVYGAILDPILSAWREWLAPWLLQRHLFHVLGFPVYAEREAEVGFGGTLVEQVDPPALAVVLGRLSLYFAVLALVAYASLRARDVT